jgi:soluble P-type ATPase
MAKRGIEIQIPGFGRRQISTIVSDYTGTCSCGGKLAPGVKRRLSRLARLVDIHIITADTFNTAYSELHGLPLKLYRLIGEDHQDVQKREYLKKFELRNVAAFGNGNNDRLLLKMVREGGGLAIAVDNGEGCAQDATRNAHLFIVGAVNALDLLLETKRCTATLRF